MFIPLLIIFLSIPGFAQSVAQAGLLKLFPVLFAQAQAVPDSSWSPEWPADLPPDAFTVSGKSVGSIELSGEDGSGTLDVKYSVASGNFEIPVFGAGAGYSLRASLDASGRIRSFTMTKTAGVATAEPASAKSVKNDGGVGVEGESTKVSLEYDPSGILMRSTIEAGEDTSFSTFSVRESLVEELVYDAEGSALARFVYHRGRTGVRSLEQVGEDGIPSLLVGFDYDGRGRVSAVGTGSGSTETLYDAVARPVFIRTLAAENAVTERRLQWDERNLLVRETLQDQDGKTMEFRYEYVFDRYGNWMERRSLVYAERMGVYIPQNGPKVIRKITYR